VSESKRSFVVGDAEYLKALSGYKQKTAVAHWCTKNKIKFFRNAQGWPVTTATALDSALAGKAASGPDWSYFEPDPNSTHSRHKRRRENAARGAQANAEKQSAEKRREAAAAAGDVRP
jgi:hypothetical protein